MGPPSSAPVGIAFLLVAAAVLPSGAVEADAALTITDLQLEPEGTAAVVTWTTSMPATSAVAYGTHDLTLRAGSAWPTTAHRVVLDRLSPGSEVRYEVTSAAPGASAALAEGAFTTAAEVTSFLHTGTSPLGLPERWMDPWDSAGDLDGRGYNGYGAALATVQGLTGQPLPLYGEVADTYPAVPAHGALHLPPGAMPTATVFVKLVASGPTVAGMGSTLREGAPGMLLLRTSLRAGSEVVAVGQRLVTDLPGEDRFFPVVVPMALVQDQGTGVVVPPGALSLEVRANASSSGYRFGFEGDHASRLDLPVEPGGRAPLGSGLVVPRAVMAGAPARFEAWALGGAGGHTFAWEVDGVAAGEGPAIHPTFGVAGRSREVAVTVTDAAGEAQRHAAQVRVHQRDLAEGPRVVVAVLDSGVNPYHAHFARPGLVLPSGALGDATRNGLPPREVAVQQQGSYEERVARDEAAWAGIAQRDLVHFAGTNLMGVAVRDADGLAHRLRDADGHGTAVAGSVVAAFPDALVVMVQVTDGAGLLRGLDWVLAQPWVDVVGVSWGHLANLPFPPSDLELALRTRALAAQGKVVVASAGNDPVPLFTDPVDGPPWVWSVAGAQQEGRTHEAVSAWAYPDFAGPFSVTAPRHDRADGATSTWDGTSFAAPTVAGVAGAVLHGIRATTGHQGSGPLPGSRALAPGGVTAEGLRAALNATTLVPPFDGDLAGQHASVDVAHVPGAEFLTLGWGYADGRVVAPAQAWLRAGSEGVPRDKVLAGAYMGQVHAARAATWEALLPGGHPVPVPDPTELRETVEEALEDLLGPPQ